MGVDERPSVPWETFFRLFKYKSNFYFFCEYDISEGCDCLTIRMMVSNSRGFEVGLIPIQKRMRLAEWQTFASLYEQALTIYDEIVGAECHEIGEWFRLDDELVFDPHKQEAVVDD